MSKVLQEMVSGGLPSSTETNPRDHVKSFTTTEKAETPSIHRIGPHQYAVSSFKDEDKMPLIELSRATIPFPSRLKESGYDEKEVLNEKYALRVPNDKIVFEDFLELNNLNEPLELRNHEMQDLSPTIEEGEVIDEPIIDVVKIRHDNKIVEKIDEYPSLAILVFSPRDDPIACLNKAIAFLTVVASRRVTVQQVQGRQGQNYFGTGYKSNAASFGGNNASGQAREAEQILDEEQLAFLADPGVPYGQAVDVSLCKRKGSA
ncbi:hypothetical protein Tco_0999186 [Tanacetum coccineum]